MPDTPDTPLDTPRDPFDPRYYDQVCFACGDRNAHGLHMRFERDGDGVLCRYRPREADQGFPGVLHGGILSTLLDESMAWAMWAHSRALGVTAKMETRYRRPVPSEAELHIRARVTTASGRRLAVEATLGTPEGDVLVEASALFLRLPPEEEAKVAAALGWDSIEG